MRKRILTTALGWLGIFATASAEPPNDHEILVIVGAAGEENYAEGFEEAAAIWEQAQEAANASMQFVGRQQGKNTTDKEKISEWIQNLDTRISTPAWIIYIGHGTYNQRDAFLNLAGPDISAKELVDLLPVMERTLIFVHGGSASSPFMKSLSDESRIILTATRNPDEINYTRFGEYFAGLITSAEGDIDQDGQTSLLEAYIATSGQVEGFYKEAARLASEHALLDDNGDQQGTPPDWFQGVRVKKRARGEKEPDGFRAHQIALIPSELEKLLSPEQRTQRNALEADLETLRKRKDALDESVYYELLESILSKLSKIYLGKDSHPEKSGNS
ncbi:MAG: hypothetical protein CMI18_05350 [Opitutaceae bacterium]|nr:hypothetical protein [Opitutaceae bacterium]